MRRILLICLILSFVSCSDVDEQENGIKNLMHRNVIIPYQSMDVRYNCDISKNVQSNQNIQIVFVLGKSNCSKCKLMAINPIEEKCREVYHQVRICYIVLTDKDNVGNMSKLFNDVVVDGTVCLDTCNAFLSANPQIPDNELFHTFVINNEGKVLMVGNPFQNEKMETLFKKVIANERKKHKTKKSA